jgi:hypothetical protein
MKVSLTGVEVSDRSEFLLDFARRMGQANRLPALTDIERLWFELSREMVASGEVVTKPQTVLTNDGKEIQRPVTRIGVFNVVADGKFLRYVPETGRLVEYERQPNDGILPGPLPLFRATMKLWRSQSTLCAVNCSICSLGPPTSESEFCRAVRLVT